MSLVYQAPAKAAQDRGGNSRKAGIQEESGGGRCGTLRDKAGTEEGRGAHTDEEAKGGPRLTRIPVSPTCLGKCCCNKERQKPPMGARTRRAMPSGDVCTIQFDLQAFLSWDLTPDS